MSEEVKKVLANCAQNFSDSEKLQARTNIGAIGGIRVTDTSGTTDLVPDEQGRVTVDLTNAGKVQSDWGETNPNEASYIKNKPTIPPAPVQSDWAEADNSSLAFIQNKPENLVQDANYVHTDNNFTNNDKGKLDGIEAGAEQNVQADWNQTNSSADDYIKNKPTIPQQVQSDWAESNSAAPSYIQNKPNLATVATSGSYNDLSDKPDIPSQQVQSDWTETDTTNPAYIKNKPADMETKPLVAGTNIEFVQEENAVRVNAIIPNAVIAYSGSPQMSQAQMTAISNIVNAHGTATILYGSPSNSTYWDLIKYDSSGYDFGRVSGATVEVMHVTQSGYVSITQYPVSGPKAYSLGDSDWYHNITLSGQTSNTSLVNHATALPNPITLYPGKNYLITGNCNGSAEWTTTETTDGTNRFGICLALTKSDYSIQYNERVTVGQAQFYFHTDKGSRTPGYHFNVAIQGVTSVVSPSSQITLTNVVTYNSGNVLGCSSSNPAKLYTDFELGNLVVQEIS